MNVNELIIKLLHLPNQKQEVTPELLEAAGVAKEENKKILFLCDHSKECGINGCGECRHTQDVAFAENFTKFSEDLYMEYDPEAYRKESTPLKIKVPKETWAVSLTVIAKHKGNTDTSCAISAIIEPEDELEISWDTEDPCVLKDVIKEKKKGERAWLEP